MPEDTKTPLEELQQIFSEKVTILRNRQNQNSKTRTALRIWEAALGHVQEKTEEEKS